MWSTRSTTHWCGWAARSSGGTPRSPRPEPLTTPRPPRPDVVVIGAGVSGLTTAVCLQEAGYAVRVVADRPPRQTTSVAAGAMWGPYEPVPEWSRTSLREFTALAADPATGVRLTRGLQGADFTDQLPPWVDELPEVEVCPPERLPAGTLAAARTRVPLIEMPRYLDHLGERFTSGGGSVEIRRLDSLEAAAREAEVVVNCAGVGAADLAADPTVQPDRGQSVVVENPGIDEFFIRVSLGPDPTSYFPHGDHVVLGGVNAVGDWNTEPDPATTAAILDRCAAVEPRLRQARVLEQRVGLRPARPSVRLDAESVGGMRCVHNYGHGGMGVTLSWGCARDVVDLVRTA